MVFSWKVWETNIFSNKKKQQKNDIAFAFNDPDHCVFYSTLRDEIVLIAFFPKWNLWSINCQSMLQDYNTNLYNSNTTVCPPVRGDNTSFN